MSISTKISYWVVSPNVRNNEKTVGAWRQASVSAHAAFMGYYPDDSGHGQIGLKFADKTKRGIKTGDIILIARRHQHKPEIVGFGSLRWLRPFIPWSQPPSEVPLKKVVRHTKALVQLHPDRNHAHREVCEWIEQQLQNRSSGRDIAERKNKQKSNPPNSDEGVIVSSPENHQLDYKVQTKAKLIKAKNIEAELLQGYRHWLEQQDRKLSAVKYKTLRCDAFEENRRNLIEAKSSASREHIRMAVGQILDYAFQGNKKFGDPHKAILLPSEPRSDIVDWLDSLKINIIWRKKRTFLDNADGQFT